MKGNRGSDGATLPGIPFDWAPIGIPAPMAQAATPQLATQPPARRGRRWLLMPSIALIGIAGLVIALVVALNGGDDGAAAANGQTPPDESVSLALPGTPTHTPEPTATATPTESPTVVATVAGAASDPATSTATAPPPTAEPTAAGPVRVRYEVVAGDSCDLLRQKFGFPATSLDNFATALIRISGRPPATGCNFRQSDIVCIPTPSDLEQLDVLARDAACLLGVTPTATS